MTRKELFKVLECLMSACGKVKKDTIIPQDPTARSVWTHSVFMHNTFEPDGTGPLDKEEPIPGMVHITVTDIWDRQIHIKLESGAEFEMSIESAICQMGKNTGKTRTYYTGQHWMCQHILIQLINSGDWSGNDPREYEPDPMGCLSDYE